MRAVRRGVIVIVVLLVSACLSPPPPYLCRTVTHQATREQAILCVPYPLPSLPPP